MNWGELSIIFGLGLVSSLHCVQMCGPLVLSYSLPLSHLRPKRQLFAHLSYNVGRLITYTTLGAVAGLTGHSLGFVGHLAGIENTAALIAGGLMVIAGLLMLDLLPLSALQRFDPIRYLSRLFRPLGSRLSSPTISSKFTLGLMLGFLPCGLIYAALLKAMATGSIGAGALTMAAFGLGTAGSLLAIGLFSTALTLRMGRWGSRLAAVSVTLLGAVLVWRGLLPLLAAQATQAAPQCHH